MTTIRNLLSNGLFGFIEKIITKTQLKLVILQKIKKFDFKFFKRFYEINL